MDGAGFVATGGCGLRSVAGARRSIMPEREILPVAGPLQPPSPRASQSEVLHMHRILIVVALAASSSVASAQAVTVTLSEWKVGTWPRHRAGRAGHLQGEECGYDHPWLLRERTRRRQGIAGDSGRSGGAADRDVEGRDVRGVLPDVRFVAQDGGDVEDADRDRRRATGGTKKPGA